MCKLCFFISVFPSEAIEAQETESVQLDCVKPVLNVPLHSDIPENETNKKHNKSNKKNPSSKSDSSVSPKNNVKIIGNVPRVQRNDIRKSEQVSSLKSKSSTESAAVIDARSANETVTNPSLPHVITVRKPVRTATVSVLTDYSDVPEDQKDNILTESAASDEIVTLANQNLDLPDETSNPTKLVCAINNVISIKSDNAIPTDNVDESYVKMEEEDIDKQNIDNIPGDATQAISDDSEMGTVQTADGENVMVQHYLLTSIITNTLSGQQTSQLITTPIVLPNSDATSDNNITTVPIQIIGNSVIANDDEESGDVMSLSESNSTSLENVCTSDSYIPHGDSNTHIAGDMTDMPTAARCVPIYHNTSAKDKINISFAEQSSASQSTEDSSNAMELVFESMIEDSGSDMITNSSNPDPHCEDRCSDYTQLVDTDKEYSLINPVTDGFHFQDDLENSLPATADESNSENSDIISLSVAASQELSDALSGL